MGAVRPRVFRLSLRLAGLAGLEGGCVLGVVFVEVRGVLVLLVMVGCLGGASSGGSSPGERPSSSGGVFGDAGASMIGPSLQGACLRRERVRRVRLKPPLWKSSVSL